MIPALGRFVVVVVVSVAAAAAAAAVVVVVTPHPPPSTLPTNLVYPPNTHLDRALTCSKQDIYRWKISQQQPVTPGLSHLSGSSFFRPMDGG